MSDSVDLVVVGLGAMGSSTVDAAARAGLSVVGLEAFGQGHANGSSHGPTRILRRSIEEGPQYVPLVLDAIERWNELNDELDEPVFVANGAIRLAPAGSELHRRFVASALVHHLDFDRLTAVDVRRTFPAFAVPDGYEALLERDAGVLFAARAVRALQDRAERHGAVLHFDRPVLSWAPDGDGVVVSTAGGTLRAARLVVTAGAWTSRLAADLALPLIVDRVVNVSFTPADPAPFSAERLPAFLISDGTDGIYGTPAIAGNGVKLGAEGTPTDPDHVDRVVTPAEVARLRGWVDRFLPGASGPVAATLTCIYTVAPDGDFVIDRHPEHDRVVIASPCSGHGFKYTTAIGPLLVELATTGTTRHAIDTFAIGRFAAASSAPG